MGTYCDGCGNKKGDCERCIWHTYSCTNEHCDENELNYCPDCEDEVLESCPACGYDLQQTD
jgi:hypothetical protein